MKKCVSISFLFVGSVIGAGFASGREILTFFSGNLAFAPLGLLACGVTFFLVNILFLSISQKIRFSDISSVTNRFPRRWRTFFEVAILFSFVVVSAMMLSGADSLFGDGNILGISSILLFAVGSVVVALGLSGLLFINTLLVPVLIAFILGISITVLVRLGVPELDFSAWNYMTSIFQGVNYAGMNLLLSAMVMLKAGGGLSTSQIRWSSAISAVVLSAVAGVFLFAMNTSEVYTNEAMPIVAMTASISPFLKWTTIFVVWIGIFTTFASSFSTCFDYLGKIFRGKILRLAMLFLLCYPISRLGFSGIVAIFLPAFGVLGIIFVALCIFSFPSDRKNNNNFREDFGEVQVSELN